MLELRGKRVAVTGGAGFIGSHLVDALLDRDNKVVVVDDFSSGSRRNLIGRKDDPRLSVIEADVTDALAMDLCLKGTDCVFHLATRNVRISLKMPTMVHDVNTTGTLNVLKAAARAGVQRFLYCSSSEVNGTADIVPMAEDYTYRPETIYGASKLAGEYYAQVFHRSGWLPTVIARPHNNYGPREHYEGFKGEVIPRFILQALAGKPPTIYGDGSQTRDFTYVTETVDFLIRLLETDHALGETYNVCRGEEVSIQDIATTIGTLTGLVVPAVFLPSRPADVLRLCGDNRKLKSLLNDSPSISIEDGLARTIAWFREYVFLSAATLESLQGENWSQTPPEVWLSEVQARQAGAAREK